MVSSGTIAFSSPSRKKTAVIGLLPIGVVCATNVFTVFRRSMKILTLPG